MAAMHILEQRDTLVLTNGAGSPRRAFVLQAMFVLPIALGLLIGHISAAINGWPWGWLSLLIIPPGIWALFRIWREFYHATLEIDRRFGRVRIERRFAHRTEEEKLALGDVVGLEVEVEADHDGVGSRSYTPVLALKNGRRITLGPSREERAPMERAVEAVRGAL